MRQSVHGDGGKPEGLMRPLSTVYHQLSSASYSSCLMTSPSVNKTSDDPSVFHADQLGSCFAPMDGTGAIGTAAAGAGPMIGSSLKPEIGLTTGDADCFSTRAHSVGLAYTPATAGNADSSTCLYSR